MATLGLVVVMHESVTCDIVLVTYWSQVCRKRARGWGRGARRWRGVAVSMTQGAFALADEGLLVPLHPLQLLISTHLAPLLLLRRVPGVQTLQGTFWSLLRGVEGELITERGKKIKTNLTSRRKLMLIRNEKGTQCTIQFSQVISCTVYVRPQMLIFLFQNNPYLQPVWTHYSFSIDKIGAWQSSHIKI